MIAKTIIAALTLATPFAAARAPLKREARKARASAAVRIVRAARVKLAEAKPNADKRQIARQRKETRRTVLVEFE